MGKREQWRSYEKEKGVKSDGTRRATAPGDMSISFPSSCLYNASFNPDSSYLSNRRSVITFSSRHVDDVTAPAESLRQLLRAPGIHLGPACFDALSAKLVERAGFDFCFTTGTFPFLFQQSELLEIY